MIHNKIAKKKISKAYNCVYHATSELRRAAGTQLHSVYPSLLITRLIKLNGWQLIPTLCYGKHHIDEQFEAVEWDLGVRETGL